VADDAARGGVRALLRLEGLAMLGAAVAAYAQFGVGQGYSWGFFAALFLLPDLSLLGYLAGSRHGAWLYNAAHSSTGPLLLVAGGLLIGWPAAVPLALVWLAHIGFDRALGYGLKYHEGFRLTHLGRIGPADPW
jgi:hypothetical protein